MKKFYSVHCSRECRWPVTGQVWLTTSRSTICSPTHNTLVTGRTALQIEH